ncbi:flagellar basal body-associated FliL family protein [Pseudodesulfovibrio senegalensis]|uniref:Flagellar protein FliL n=1 Tax=Pseudodesulfovibrio senegalensis TaxID=1721087 RepID=A0A6N6N5X9_9BACT|nr:flagellar basal body-associated FliL family protein [Pseudodesulfovibrio senegalensis]KAB1443650.1 flagellar basal body-associated FliL family protein [Pseudodesulfovibrio senegalensis]
MVLLVPDDSEEVAAPPVDASAESSGQPKAQLDDSEASKATQKVDLDLDDAPFLEDEEEEEIELEEPEEPALEDEEPKKKKGLPPIFKNKLFYMGLTIALLLIVIVVLLFSRPSAPPPPPPETQQTEPAPEPVVEPENVKPNDILLRLDPFLIEQKDSEGTIRFLEVRLVLNTTNDELAQQFKQETFTIRNAIYYYLKNKDLAFLSDKKNADKLKKELLAVVNQYMAYGRFESLLFEQYLVR